MSAFLRRLGRRRMWLKIAGVALAVSRPARHFYRMWLVSLIVSSASVPDSQILRNGSASKIVTHSLLVQVSVPLLHLAQPALTLPSATRCKLNVYSSAFYFRLVQFECLLECIAMAKLEKGAAL
jgi:hypothetical protein